MDNSELRSPFEGLEYRREKFFGSPVTTHRAPFGSYVEGTANGGWVECTLGQKVEVESESSEVALLKRNAAFWEGEKGREILQESVLCQQLRRSEPSSAAAVEESAASASGSQQPAAQQLTGEGANPSSVAGEAPREASTQWPASPPRPSGRVSPGAAGSSSDLYYVAPGGSGSAEGARETPETFQGRGRSRTGASRRGRGAGRARSGGAVRHQPSTRTLR